MKLPYILKKPLITERSVKLAKSGEYTFEVDPQATKGQIKEAVKIAFGVDAVNVRTTKRPGNQKRVGKKRQVVITGAGKKAIIKVKPNQKIELFEVGQ